MDELLRQVRRAGGDYGAAHSVSATAGPRPIEYVKREMRGLWAGGEITPALEISGHGRLTPPTIQFADACRTEHLLRTRMVHKGLWDEAQAALRWLLANQPPLSASPQAKAAWVADIFSWIGVQTIASNLHPMFWYIPEAGLEPVCRDPATACAPDLLQRGGAVCCPPWAPWKVNPAEPWPHDSAKIAVVPHPLVRIAEFARRHGFKVLGQPSTAGSRCLSGFIRPRGAPQPNIASGGPELWLDYQVGPVWEQQWAVAPAELLVRFRAAATRDAGALREAEAMFFSMDMPDQLANIFNAVTSDQAVGQVRGGLDPARHGGCDQMWTLATSAGLLTQARWWAEHYASIRLDVLLGRAMLFYTANHLPWFIERGIINVPPGDIKAAYDAMKAQGAQQVGAIMEGLGTVLLAVVAAAAGTNVILGVLTAIVVGLYQLWVAATGSTGFEIFIGAARPNLADDVPQPLFIRTMPACEAAAVEIAQANNLPLQNIDAQLQRESPILRPSVALMLGAALGGLIGWALS